ncbi:MAG: hypothetical protein OWS74_04320, partial [Firmicutes bacterium]|nr:hypothetical protein [Bacillota bacterium]
MNMLPAALSGMAVYLWRAPSLRGLWNIFAGLAIGLGLSGPNHWATAGLCAGAAAVWVAGPIWWERRTLSGKDLRQWSVWYWQAVALYLTAGLPFWSAVDMARKQTPILEEGLVHAAQAVASGQSVSAILQAMPPSWRADEMVLIVT